MFHWQRLSVRFFTCCSFVISSFLFPHAVLADALEVREQPQPLVIGAISKNPKKHIQFAQPLADYLAVNLTNYGVSGGRVIVMDDLDEMGKMLQTGQVDLVSDTLFSALKLKEKYGAEILLKRWKKGVDSYSSVIFVRKEAGLDSLGDLKGKLIAFEDRHSTSGFFIPATSLISQGYQLIEMDSLEAPVPKDKIGYVFAKELLSRGNEISISSWVSRGVVDAGAFSDSNWNDTEDMPSELRTQLSILYQSQPFPRSLQLVRPGIDPEMKQSIRTILLGASETPEGGNALRKYQKTSQFDELDDMTQQTLDQASGMKVILDKQLVAAGVAR